MAEQKPEIPDRLIPKPYKVLDFKRETADNFTLKIAMPINHHPGQFVQVTIPGIGEAPISLCSDSREYIELNIREVGNVTRALSKLKRGDTIYVRGPYGHGYPMDLLKGNNLLVIGGGCGVAPLRGVLKYVENNRADYKDIHLFFGYRSPNDILFSKEVSDWKGKYDLNLSVDKNPTNAVCVDAKVGYVTEVLKNSNVSNNNIVAFLCGPPVMMKLVIDILKQKGFHDDQIFISAERLMYCGIGVCCHCMIHGKFTCLDGPVFRYDEIKDYKND